VAYAGQADLEAYFGTEQLLIAADRDGNGSADSGVITAGITAAEEEIDSYLAVRYDLPLAATPGVLKRICCDLAMYHMSVGHHSMTDDKETRYNNGVRWLEKVSKGLVTLGVEEEEVVVQDEATVASATSTDAEDRLMTRDTLKRLF